MKLHGGSLSSLAVVCIDLGIEQRQFLSAIVAPFVKGNSVPVAKGQAGE